MPLKETISGFRGTFGGRPGDNLTPVEIQRYAVTYAKWLKKRHDNPGIVVGRDGRITGKIVSELAINTLLAMGVNVVDLGISTTPTTELAVPHHGAQGGIIFTASHNPKEWNAFKFLNDQGEFLSPEHVQALIDGFHDTDVQFATVDTIGIRTIVTDELEYHVKRVLEDELVDPKAVRQARLKIAVDAINSSGALIIPRLLEAMGCEVVLINGDVSGRFNHNPEPLAKNLTQLMETVVQTRSHLGIAVDPDVDRLAFVTEQGTYFGEEYTLAAIADYVLSRHKGTVVSNLSSSAVLDDVAAKHGVERYETPVGEVHVVAGMKEVGAVIGGEGNGGVIYPPLHYGRDAIIGIALFLSYMAKSERRASAIRSALPDYHISKNKVSIPKDKIPDVLDRLKHKYKDYPQNTQDGLKIYLDMGWAHIRASNTEPVVRVISESSTPTMAHQIAASIITDIGKIIV